MPDITNVTQLVTAIDRANNRRIWHSPIHTSNANDEYGDMPYLEGNDVVEPAAELLTLRRDVNYTDPTNRPLYDFELLSKHPRHSPLRLTLSAAITKAAERARFR